MDAENALLVRDYVDHNRAKLKMAVIA